MQSVDLATALTIISTVLERNIHYTGIELARGFYATIQTELTKEAAYVADSNTNTAAE